MKFVLVLAALLAVTVGAPQEVGRPQQQRPHVAILRDERHNTDDGNFRYEFEAENGIVVGAEGVRGEDGASNIQGFYKFPLPDGTLAEVNFVADQDGYRAESDLLPTPHPLPAHAVEQIRVAEEQRAQGITFE